MPKKNTVWIVYGGVNYQGEDIASLRIFKNEKDADAYDVELKTQHYDYTDVEERPIL